LYPLSHVLYHWTYKNKLLTSNAKVHCYSLRELPPFRRNRNYLSYQNRNIDDGNSQRVLDASAQLLSISMIYNLLDFRLLVSDANPTVGGDGVFALWALRACSYKPKGETAHQGLSTERHSIRRKQTLACGRNCSHSG